MKKVKKFIVSEVNYSYFTHTDEQSKKHFITLYNVQFDDLKDIQAQLDVSLGEISYLELKV